jgi:hypothetical protein
MSIKKRSGMVAVLYILLMVDGPCMISSSATVFLVGMVKVKHSISQDQSMRLGNAHEPTLGKKTQERHLP